MAQIIRHHGLIPVPLDIDPVTMAPLGLESIKKLVNKNTKAVLFAHLFGIRFNIDPYVDYLEENNIDIIEDLAEAFAGFEKVRGHPRAKLSMFSFGLSKAQTTYMGSITFIRKDEDLFKRMNDIQMSYRTLSRKEFYQKCWKASKAIFYINTQFGNHIIDYAAKLKGCTR